MPDDTMTKPGMGHNVPPVYDQAALDAFLLRAREAGKASKEWGEVGVNSDEDAERLNDFINGVGLLYKEVDKSRVGAKKPHDDAAKAVQAAYKPLLEPLAAMKKKATDLLLSYKRKRDAEERAKAEAERQRAEAERKAAEEAAAKADEDGDDFAAAEMAQKAKDAEKAAKKAAKGGELKVGSASGAGTTFAKRKEITVTIENPVILATHYVRAGHSGVLEALQRAAEADVRAKDVDHTTIPGISVKVIE